MYSIPCIRECTVNVSVLVCGSISYVCVPFHQSDLENLEPFTLWARTVSLPPMLASNMNKAFLIHTYVLTTSIVSLHVLHFHLPILGSEFSKLFHAQSSQPFGNVGRWQLSKYCFRRGVAATLEKKTQEDGYGNELCTPYFKSSRTFLDSQFLWTPILEWSIRRVHLITSTGLLC